MCTPLLDLLGASSSELALCGEVIRLLALHGETSGLSAEAAAAFISFQN
jgi:hypothetical protein